MRVDFMFAIERAGDCVRTGAVLLKQILKFPRLLIHFKDWRHPMGRVRNSHRIWVSMAVVC